MQDMQNALIRLVAYGRNTDLLPEDDEIYTVNRLLELFEIDELQGELSVHEQIEEARKETSVEDLEEILKELLDGAFEKGILKENLGRNTVLLLLGALLSWGAMILSPHYPDRAAFGTMVLLICAILSMAGKIADRQKENVWMFYGCAVLIWLRGMYFLVEYLGLCWGWIK